MARRQRHLDLGDDAVDAIGVHDLEHVAPAQLHHARLVLDGHHLDPEHGTGIGDLSPGAGARSGGAAGHEAADGRMLARGRIEAQLMAGGRERTVDIEHARAGAEAPGAGPLPDHLVEPRHVEHDPALERHGLAVIAGAAAAHGERHAMLRASRRDPHQLGLVPRYRDDLGALVLQRLLQDRREPEEIAASHPQRSRILQDRNAVEVLAQFRAMQRGGPWADSRSAAECMV